MWNNEDDEDNTTHPPGDPPARDIVPAHGTLGESPRETRVSTLAQRLTVPTPQTPPSTKGSLVSNVETGDPKHNEQLLKRKPEVINLNTPPSAMKSCEKPSGTKKEAKTGMGWEGLTINGYDADAPGVLPRFVPPGDKWKENAVHSYVLVLNLVNKVLANGVRPRVFNALDRSHASHAR